MLGNISRKDGREPLQLRGRELAVSLYSNCDGSIRYSQGQSCVIVTLVGPTQENVSNNNATSGESANHYSHSSYESARVIVNIEYLNSDCISIYDCAKDHNNSNSSNTNSTNNSSSNAKTTSQVDLDGLMRAELWHDYITTHDAHRLHSFITNVLDAIVMKGKFPRCLLYFSVYVLQHDGSLASTIVNACMACLCDAGIPCVTSATAVSILCLESTTIDNNKHNKIEKKEYRTNNEEDNESEEEEEYASKETNNKVYLVDPTLSEELQQWQDNINNNNNNNNINQIKKKSLATLVLVNPSVTKRVGLLATHFDSNITTTNSLLLNSNEKLTKVNDEVTSDTTTTTNNNTVDATTLFEMIDLAHKASPMLFDFLRQCNVPLENN